jgi:hypothetical protein
VKRSTLEQWTVLVVLVVATVGLRVLLRDVPNFAPVAGVALFAGYYFRSGWLAALVPLSVLWFSDLFLGGYQPLLMLTVYGLLTMPVLLRGYLRRHLRLDGSVRGVLGSLVGLLTCGLACSLLFFLASNLMTWFVTPWYPRTVNGLLYCYALLQAVAARRASTLQTQAI